VSALFTKTLRDRRRGFLGWAAGLGGVALMYAAFYPSVKDSAADFTRYLQQLPEALKSVLGADFTSPAGYLRSETFSALGPILFLVFAIGTGSRTIAGEEEAKTLDLLLSTPIRRSQLLADTWLAMVVAGAGLAGVLFLTLALAGPAFDLSVPLANLGAACVMLWLLGLAFGSISLALGCITGHRAVANGVTGALATIAYVVNALAASVDALAFIRPLSPFRWYLDPDPLVHGLTVANVAVLGGIALAALAVAWFAFERRDLQA
jgi:ABC-2 type transport system permease protein